MKRLSFMNYLSILFLPAFALWFLSFTFVLGIDYKAYTLECHTCDQNICLYYKVASLVIRLFTVLAFACYGLRTLDKGFAHSN